MTMLVQPNHKRLLLHMQQLKRDVLSAPQAAWLQIPMTDRDAWTSFRLAAAIVLARLERDLLATSEIGYSDFDVLMQLSLAPEASLRMADLARAVSLSPSALTRLVQRLERRGFLLRTRHLPTVVEASLTDAGRRKLSNAAPPHLKSVQEIFWDPLTNDERAAVAHIGRKIVAFAKTNA